MERQGFGEAELARLGELLAGIAASQELQPEGGVAQFFETVFFDLEAAPCFARIAQAKA